MPASGLVTRYRYRPGVLFLNLRFCFENLGSVYRIFPLLLLELKSARRSFSRSQLYSPSYIAYLLKGVERLNTLFTGGGVESLKGISLLQLKKDLLDRQSGFWGFSENHQEPNDCEPTGFRLFQILLINFFCYLI